MIARFFFFISVLFVFGCSDQKDLTTIIWLRHAEKDTIENSSDPKLTPEGRNRARKLASVLDSIPISTIFSTPYKRNLQTVMPLAADKGIDIQIYERDSWSSLLDTLPSSFQGQSLLICGHRDQIFEMIQYLGVPTDRNKLEKNEYNKLFILRNAHSSPQLEISTY